jgi:hypothetical protein
MKGTELTENEIGWSKTLLDGWRRLACRERVSQEQFRRNVCSLDWINYGNQIWQVVFLLK